MKLIKILKKGRRLIAVALVATFVFVNVPLDVKAASASNDGVFKYLAIGNSFTIHPVNELWWGNYGMAATCRENDYVHQFESQIKPYYNYVETEAVYYRDWEWSAGGARTVMLPFLDGYLKPDLDLVTIFLGENIEDTSNLDYDFQNLINYIRYKSPEAKIIMIGMFWQDQDRYLTIEQIKRNVSEANQIPFVDLSEIANNDSYRAGMKTLVSGDDGAMHAIDDWAVAAHMNDSAMKYLADKLFSTYLTSGGQVYGNYYGMVNVNGTWMYCENGVVNFNYTGMALNEYGWWYFNNGQLDWTYTGMALNEYGWWYFTNGCLDLNYTGMACNEYGWWYFNNGQLDWTYTGMALNDYGWWYYNNGLLDWTYTGPAQNEYGTWWFQDGRLVL